MRLAINVTLQQNMQCRQSMCQQMCCQMSNFNCIKACKLINQTE